MRKIFPLVCVLAVNQLFSQITFEKAYRNLVDIEVARSVDLDGNGGYILAVGEKLNNSAQRINAVYRINAFGDTLWKYTYTIYPDANFQFVRRTLDGSYYIAGIETDSSTNNDYMWWIRKIDSLGNFIWKKNFAHPLNEFYQAVNTMKLRADGSFLLYLANGRIMTINSVGNIDSLRLYSGFAESFWDHKKKNIILNDSIFYYFGRYSSFPGTPKNRIMKTSYSGDTISSVILKTDSSGDYLDLLKRVNTDYLVTSYSSILVNGKYPFTLTKLDSSGNKLWNRFTLGYSGIPTSSAVLLNGTNVVCGMPNTNGIAPPNGRAFIYCFNDNGDSLWHKKFSPSDTTAKTELFDVIATPDSGLLAVGQILSSNGQQKNYVVKLDGYGNLFNPMSVIEKKKETYLHLYPNPASTYTGIHYMGVEKNAVLTITNLQGQIVFSQKILNHDEHVTISTEQFGAGFYLCNINANGITLAYKKLVITKVN